MSETDAAPAPVGVAAVYGGAPAAASRIASDSYQLAGRQFLQVRATYMAQMHATAHFTVLLNVRNFDISADFRINPNLNQTDQIRNYTPPTR